MNKLSLRARLSFGLIFLLGLLAAWYAVRTPMPSGQAEHWELGMFLILATLTGSKRIRLIRPRSPEVCPEDSAEERESLSLAFLLTFTAMIRLGPAAAVLVGMVGSLSNGLFPKRQSWHQLAFNIALSMLAAWVAGLTFLAVNHWSLMLRLPMTIVAAGAASVVFFLINVGSACLHASGHTPRTMWRNLVLRTAPGYLAGAFLSTLTMFVFGPHAGTIFLFLSPITYAAYQLYATKAAQSEEKQQHIEALQTSQEHLANLYLATIKSLALAIDAKDQYTHQHILRVQRYAVATARHLGLTGVEMEAINTGALLHDIGKLGVPEYVLLKPGRLTDEEFAKIKKHPEIGAAILDPVEFPWPVLPVVRSHHEKWDGTGYPDGLKGEDIPLTARVLAVADVFDALTSSRSYRNAWTHERACEVIKKDRGTHFDPRVADAFLEVISGVVEEMAGEGEGPLVVAASDAKTGTSKADQAARAIHRASSELWALYEVVQTLSSSLGLEETLEILGRKLEAILPGTAALFLLNDEETGQLRVRAAVGVNRDYFTGAGTLGDGSASLQVTQNRVTYLGEYDPDDLMLASAQSGPWVPLRTALIVPIVHQGETLGTINLYHPHADAFGSHDKQLLETIAERAATALYNGLLFDRTRSHAFTDPLTGLYNLRHITQHVEERCQEGVPFALLCLDLDSFKPINDNFGHQKGDEVLRDLSALFLENIREDDVAARYGGDEFLIFFRGGSREEAEALAGRLQWAVEAYEPGLLHPRLGALHLGVSIGFGCFPADGTDFASLIASADSNMYREKTERKLGKLADPDRMHLGAEFNLPRAA